MYDSLNLQGAMTGDPVNQTYDVIGAMAGSSMDGLDLAHVTFQRLSRGEEWGFSINSSDTIGYPNQIHEALNQSLSLERPKQEVLDLQFGEWIGEQIVEFIDTNQKVDLLGVHGHTLIHQPERGVSWQLGDGHKIAQITGIPTITDFRTKDATLGGQGAPLVPLGDFLLFKEYDACLNLGGIANISIKEIQMAWDICPCNQVLNYFASKLDQPFDLGGQLARTGELDHAFLKELSDIPFFHQKPPKSLPNKYLNEELLNSIEPKDGLRTYAHFIADQVMENLSETTVKNVLITGGGALNDFLVESIQSKVPNIHVVKPEPEIINFKEALIFAFLALKRSLNEINVLASVTGASKDSSSGVIHHPND